MKKEEAHRKGYPYNIPTFPLDVTYVMGMVTTMWIACGGTKQSLDRTIELHS